MTGLPLIIASLILLAGVVDDLRSRKVHNWLFLLCTGLAFGSALVAGGFAGIHSAMLGFIAGFAVLLPLVLLHVIGAGDMKLFAAFGAAAGLNEVFDVAILSLAWGAVFGIMQSLLRGELKSLLKNMVSISQLKDRSAIELHKVPFTVALLMAWLTNLVQRGVLR